VFLTRPLNRKSLGLGLLVTLWKTKDSQIAKLLKEILNM